MPEKAQHPELAWFLGPKAENADLFEELVLRVVRDYVHWRRNYFPSDPVLFGKRQRDGMAAEHDSMDGRLSELLALLRRNFPFYSPRYVAHELSDTMMSASLGYFAGMLYNPNNVTPEAAPVTTELELEVCSELLTMLGFKAPPGLPPHEVELDSYYAQRSKEEYGWAHLTSGGTIANVEALWIARQVRYSVLAIRDTAVRLGLSLTVKLPHLGATQIANVDDHALLLIKPNEAIYLFSRFLDLLKGGPHLRPDEAVGEAGWRLLSESPRALANGVSAQFENHPPVILVAGSRHYSVTKAANVLGLGHACIESIRTDESFRMDIVHLEQTLRRVVREGRVPLAVVATAGTTEEGAVDPVHDILDLRSKLETELGVSFWIHVDAAWGGYIRTLFALEAADELEAIAGSLSKPFGLPMPEFTSAGDRESHLLWHERFSARVPVWLQEQKSGTGDVPTESLARHAEEGGTAVGESASDAHAIGYELRLMGEALAAGQIDRYVKLLQKLGNILKTVTTAHSVPSFRLGRTEITEWIARYVSDRIQVADKSFTINWPDKNVASAFLAFEKVDSITVDPHKLGYAPYPAGCVAFRNDRVRSFILESAPYITSTNHDALIHLPPRHYVASEGGGRKIVTQSFSPFMLEGSRPGAVAAGLWAAMKSTPYTPRGHGRVIRASLLSARSLYEHLVRWDQVCKQRGAPQVCSFVSLTPGKPDTNLVTFVIAPAFSASLEQVNALSTLVYEHFSIQAELGEREHSYSHPFFLSKTRIGDSTYDSKPLTSFFERARLADRSPHQTYHRVGLVVLRASVMNPYILSARTMAEQDFCALFVEELAIAAAAAIREIV